MIFCKATSIALLVVAWLSTCAGVCPASQAGTPPPWVCPEAETLRYLVAYGPVLGAELTLKTEKTENGSWRFTGHCRSRGAVELFYKIRSSVTTTTHGPLFLANEFYEDRSEGGHRYHRYQFLDFRKRMGIWENYVSGHRKKLKVQGAAHDLLGVAYYVRGLPWEVGQSRLVSVFSDAAYHNLRFWCERRGVEQEGEFRGAATLRLRCDDVFEQATRRDGKLEVIVLDRADRLPVQLRLSVSWGTVVMRLCERK